MDITKESNMDNNITGKTTSDLFFNRLPLENQLKFLFSNEFAECLVTRREELGWSQDRLAEESGVNRVTIAKIETFQRTASIDIVLKLLYALGMKIQFVKDE